MFRRLSSSLPKDPEFPADLEQLGYFLNDNDQIRNISDPSAGFKYKISGNERTNEVHKEAMNECVRKIVQERLKLLGLKNQRLPPTDNATDPHIPIWMSETFPTASRIILYFGDTTQDLGILAYRKVNDSINTGSFYNIAKGVLQPGTPTAKDAPALLIANTGQLVWYRGGQKAVTMTTWYSLPRKTAVHPPMRIDPVKNRVPGHESCANHVEYIFKEVVAEEAHADAKIDVIGVGDAGLSVVRFLASNWSTWRSRVSALILVEPQHTEFDIDPYPSSDHSSSPNGPQESKSKDNDDPDHGEEEEEEEEEEEDTTFARFLSARTRAYGLSSEPVGTPIPGRDHWGCNCYSGGEEAISENIVPTAWESMLSWFELVHTVHGFEEFETLEGEGEGDAVLEKLRGEEGDGWGNSAAGAAPDTSSSSTAAAGGGNDDDAVTGDVSGTYGDDVEVTVVSPEEFDRMKREAGQ